MALNYITAFALGLAPSLIWFIFFKLEEDEGKKEPFRLAIFSFLLGAAATFIALVIQVVIAKSTGISSLAEGGFQIVAGFAFIEEVLKFAVIFFVVGKMKAFRKPLDAMLYMITAGLGFAAVENIASVINSGDVKHIFESARFLEITALRFLGATLLHTVTCGIVGFHWAIGWVRKSDLALNIAIGLAIATLIHLVFNSLVLQYGPASWALGFVAFSAFFLLIDFEELRTEEERDGFVV